MSDPDLRKPDETAQTSTMTTREKLLHAAREVFAEQGLAHTRISDIAVRSGVNRERVYGYFGSKEGLFDAVINDALDELAEAVPLTPGEDLVEYVDRVHEFHRLHPQLLRLLLWEALHYRSEPLPGEEDRRARYREKVGALEQSLGAAQGRLQAAPTLFILIGLAAWPSVVPQLARLIMGADTSEDPELMRAHVLSFASAALRPEDQAAAAETKD
ncbi:TetR family transcriptional regulator [Glycomyces luteolus]|uniref:TetR family transcriptional regulator n=1 Tax=Glycomyces luteolus TaxID=2670330 RepID=A0A9X3SS22_9ACTN|nr:TetR family transcriptional regulator [Glycomyces luteolus]MDA1358963.1 TetR family transcriptional regulator [Glycomyces luteolus]